MELRVLLADDHQMFRDALCNLLHSRPGLEVVAQTGDGLQVLGLARACAPHIVCMDIGMPGMNGVEVTRALRAAMPHVKVIALSAYTDQRYVMDMLGAGACGYVTKAEASDELLRAIEMVQRGRTYLCPDVSGAVADAVLNKGDRPQPTSALGARERQVLQLVAEGYTSNQIGQKLHIASSTVEVHRRNIMRKLGLHSVAELTRYVVIAELPPL
ncbi:MAG: hypothetical protein RLZ81_3235 [Pseudomonadota bacterium]|jgi:two-component system NarL family response regulator